MIELLLQAERARRGRVLDQAERLYWQAIDADSQNAIAIVGLAKVARLRGDDRTAIAFGRRALKVDSENAVARRLVAELETAHPRDPPGRGGGPPDGPTAPRWPLPTEAARAGAPTREPRRRRPPPET